MPVPETDGKSRIVPCACCGSLVFKSALNCEGFSFTRCVSCGLVQRNPQPLREEINARYSNIYGNDYLSYELENEAAFLNLQQLALKDAGFEKIEKELFSRCPEDPPSILDIGCATGALLANLRDRVTRVEVPRADGSDVSRSDGGEISRATRNEVSRAWRVTGVEISPGAEYAKNERKLEVYNIPLEEIKFKEYTFDVIHASHLIEHLNDPKTFLTETHRILKNDGYCFITTPNIDGFQARLFGGRWRSAIFDHLYLFSARTLSVMLKNTGFKIECIKTWGGLAAGAAPLPVKKAADYLAKKFGCGDVMIIRARKTLNF